MEFLHGLRYSTCSEQLQPMVVRAALDAVGDVKAVRWLYKKICRLFGNDGASTRFMQKEIEAWLAWNDRPNSP